MSKIKISIGNSELKAIEEAFRRLEKKDPSLKGTLKVELRVWKQAFDELADGMARMLGGND